MEQDLIRFATSGEYYFLSNFYPYPLEGTSKKWTKLKIEYPEGSGKYWPTSEHLYQALKFNWNTPLEKEWRELIRKSNTPTIAKYLGHQSTHTRYGWQAKYRTFVNEYKDRITYRGKLDNPCFKLEIMHITLTAKFKIPELRKQLLETGNKELFEWSKDEFWGQKAGDTGQNNLGKLLMQVRRTAKKS